MAGIRGSSWRASRRSLSAVWWSPAACAARASRISRRASICSRCCCRRAFGFARDATAAGFLPWRPGAARIMLGHAAQGLVDLTDSFPGDSEFLGVREGLADTAARVDDLTARVLDVGQSAGLACLQLGKAVF